MTTTTPVRSWPAIALGSFFAIVTARVLFDDAWNGAPITTTHVLSLAALVAAIASGHMAWPALRSGRVMPALMLPVLFLAGTGYVVVNSGARNAERAGDMAAAIHDTNVKRAEQTRLKTRAQAMLDEATKKCSTGKVCLESTKATIAVYEAAIAGHNAILDRLGPERPENGGYAHAAKVIAALPGVTANAAGIEARLALILPFVTVLITELGTIAFLHLGLGHRTLAKPASEPAAPKAPSGPKGGTRKSRRGATSKDPKVVGFVTEYRRRHGTDPSIPTMQAKFPGMAASTAQRYRRDAGKLGAVATIRAVA